MSRTTSKPLSASEYNSLQTRLDNAESESAALDELTQSLIDNVQCLTGQTAKRAKALLKTTRIEKRAAEKAYWKLHNEMNRVDATRRANGYCPECGQQKLHGKKRKA